MKRAKKLMIFISLVMLTIFIGGCGMMNKDDNQETNKKLNKEEQIKQKFSQTLDMYPIKNLEDLYDKEGFRDEEFDKDDKGIWVISSSMKIQPKGKAMVSKGMVLFIDRNKKRATGKYIVRKSYDDHKTKLKVDNKEYPVELKNNKIIPIEKLHDEKIKKEIKEFKFFSQYADFKGLKNYKDGRISYNPNVPNYTAEYQINNDDYNVKKLKEIYNLKTKETPELILKGTGKINGSSIGDKSIEYNFVQKEDENIYFTDSLTYEPSEE